MRREKMSGSWALREFIRRYGIEAGAFDLDDNLVRTNVDAFRRQMDAFAGNIVAAEPDIPFPYMQQVVRDANNHVHHDFHVNPKRWKYVIDVLGDMLGGSLRPLLRRHLPTLLSIYSIAPRAYPGALRTVAEFAKHVPVGINSHALAGWTIYKLEQEGFGRYVSHVHVVPVTKRFKDERDWHETAVALGTRPRRLFVSGDSLIADAKPSLDAGVPEYLVFLSESAWGKHNSNGHDVPGGIHTPRGIADLIPTIARVMM